MFIRLMIIFLFLLRLGLGKYNPLIIYIKSMQISCILIINFKKCTLLKAKVYFSRFIKSFTYFNNLSIKYIAY